MAMGVAYHINIYDLIGQHYSIHMHMLTITYLWWNTKLLSLQPDLWVMKPLNLFLNC